MTFIGEQAPIVQPTSLEPTTGLTTGVPPEEVRTMITAWHNSDLALDDSELDHLIFGDDIRFYNDLLMLSEGQWYSEAVHKNENLWLSSSSNYSTSYGTIRSIIKALDLSADDVLYDLGAGFGRLPIYAALTTPASCQGVEILAGRVKVANDAAARLGLDNVQLIDGLAQDVDFSDGNTFFMYQPFKLATFEAVLVKLKRIATAHKVRVVMRGSSDLMYRQGSWVTKSASVIPISASPLSYNPRIDIFESV